MPSRPGGRRLDALGDEHEAGQRARELVAALHAGHALGRPRDLGDLVRRALPDEPRDERAALAARDGGDEESGQRRGAGRQRDLLVAESARHAAEHEREQRADGRIARALRVARKRGGGSVRIDGVLVDDGCEWLGHAACIGRFPEDLPTPSIEGVRPAGPRRRARRADARDGWFRLR